MPRILKLAASGAFLTLAVWKLVDAFIWDRFTTDWWAFTLDDWFDTKHSYFWFHQDVVLWIGVAALVLAVTIITGGAVLYLIDKHGPWRRVLKISVGLGVLGIFGISGWFGWEKYNAYRTEMRTQVEEQEARKAVPIPQCFVPDAEKPWTQYQHKQQFGNGHVTPDMAVLYEKNGTIITHVHFCDRVNVLGIDAFDFQYRVQLADGRTGFLSKFDVELNKGMVIERETK